MRIVTTLAVTLALGSCAWTTEPEFGDLQVTTVTSGLDLDLDGYVLTVDGPFQHLNANGTVVLSRLNAGRHEANLSNLASNCTPQGGERFTLEVLPQQTITLTLNITCVATTGVIEVAVVSTGAD